MIFFERQKCKQKFAESVISSFPWSTSSWTGFVLVVFFAFTWRGLAVGVLIILTMQSGRKWAKRRWWWQAGCYLYQPALLTSPCKCKYTHTDTQIQIHTSKYRNTNAVTGYLYHPAGIKHLPYTHTVKLATSTTCLHHHLKRFSYNSALCTM